MDAVLIHDSTYLKLTLHQEVSYSEIEKKRFYANLKEVRQPKNKNKIPGIFSINESLKTFYVRVHQIFYITKDTNKKNENFIKFYLHNHFNKGVLNCNGHHSLKKILEIINSSFPPTYTYNFMKVSNKSIVRKNNIKGYSNSDMTLSITGLNKHHKWKAHKISYGKSYIDAIKLFLNRPMHNIILLTTLGEKIYINPYEIILIKKKTKNYTIYLDKPYRCDNAGGNKNIIEFTNQEYYDRLISMIYNEYNLPEDSLFIKAR